MKKIPIVFCFDDNLLMPAGVCLTSLLENASPDTFYDIFILYDQNCQFPQSGFLENLYARYSNFKITYRNVGYAFAAAFQIRGITQATYYRLLIPKFIPEYDKIMYHDVDVIFRNDLSEIFNDTDIENEYIAGVVSPVSLDRRLHDHMLNLQVDPMKYISAGNIIINSALILKEGILAKFEAEATKKYEFQDMDIINVVCKGKIKRISPVFCGTIEVFRLASSEMTQPFYSKEELQETLCRGIIHYNGIKPWKNYCPNMDIWWEYYRKSIYYDKTYYFNFFHGKMNELDTLPLLKRIKILARYFIIGKSK
ncbi:glycosyltransferase family 8 protein [Sphingobacterium spiritivorum]